MDSRAKPEATAPKPGRIATTLAALAAMAAVSTCVSCGDREQRFESTCQLIHRDVVEQNDKGEPEIMDIELAWDPCPGYQFQVVRGGKDFATCMQKYELGKLLPVLVKHWWDDRGYYVWDVYKVGDCVREIESGAEGSYEKSLDCKKKKQYGQVNGFSCSRRGFKSLVATCPWMARR